MKPFDLSKMSEKQLKAYFRRLRKNSSCIFEYCFTTKRLENPERWVETLDKGRFQRRLWILTAPAREFQRDYITVKYYRRNREKLQAALASFKSGRFFYITEKEERFRIKLVQRPTPKKRKPLVLSLEEAAYIDQIIKSWG